MSKQTLENYRSTLQSLRTRLIQEVNSAESALREDISTPGDVTHVPTHPSDQDVAGLDEQLAIAANEEQLLEEVETALERIEAGTFGRCVDCNQPIDSARLKAIPYASRCIACAKQHEQAESA